MAGYGEVVWFHGFSFLLFGFINLSIHFHGNRGNELSCLVALSFPFFALILTAGINRSPLMLHCFTTNL